MIAPFLLSGTMVLLATTCVYTSDDETCFDRDNDGICDDRQPAMNEKSLAFGIDGLQSPAALVVTPLVPDVIGIPCTATLGVGGDFFTLTGSLTETGFELWGGAIALQAQHAPKSLDYDGTLVLGAETFTVSLTPRASRAPKAPVAPAH